MKTRRTLPNGEMTSDFAEDAAAVGELIRRRLKFFLGEWPYNQRRVGTNIEHIFSKDEAVRLEEIKTRIEQTKHVQQIAGLSAIINSNRVIEIKCTVITDFGIHEYIQ
jgi:hypothetical protein